MLPHTLTWRITCDFKNQQPHQTAQSESQGQLTTKREATSKVNGKHSRLYSNPPSKRNHAKRAAPYPPSLWSSHATALALRVRGPTRSRQWRHHHHRRTADWKVTDRGSEQEGTLEFGVKTVKPKFSPKAIPLQYEKVPLLLFSSWL